MRQRTEARAARGRQSLQPRRGEAVEHVDVGAKWLRGELVCVYRRRMAEEPVRDGKGTPPGSSPSTAQGRLKRRSSFLSEDCPEWGHGKGHQQGLAVMVVFEAATTNAPSQNIRPPGTQGPARGRCDPRGTEAIKSWARY